MLQINGCKDWVYDYKNTQHTTILLCQKNVGNCCEF